MTTEATVKAPREPVVDVVHGVEVPDPYRWLEESSSSATATWSAEQDVLWQSVRDSLPGRDEWRLAVRRYYDVTRTSAPVWRGRHQFRLKQEPGRELSRLYVFDENGGERLLLDAMDHDPSGKTTLNTWQPSPDGARIACTLSRGGHEEASLYVVDVDSGAVIDGPIDRCGRTSIAWLPGHDAFYYVRQLAKQHEDSEIRRRIYLHTVGESPAEDSLIFGEGTDGRTLFRIVVSRDGRWLVISKAEGSPSPGNELWLADLGRTSAAEPVLLQIQDRFSGNTGVSFDRAGRMVLLTNRDAPNKRILVADPECPDGDAWRELVPENDLAVITDYAFVDGPDVRTPLLLVAYARQAISEVEMFDPVDGRHLGAVSLPGAGSIGPLIEKPEGGNQLWFTYTDHLTPPRVQIFDARTSTTSDDDEGPAPQARVRSTRGEYVSADGMNIQMLVLEQPGSAGPRPTILGGYGGFGISMVPAYSASILAWVQAGGRYVVPSLRGGGEHGKKWHDAGRLGNKQNVFDDFISCAEHLVSEGLTTPAMLGAFGGSNGGLLIGAAITQRPDLFAAAVCSAPLLDMVRYEHSGLGSLWTSEYGTVTDPRQFEWLLGYSPYHRVREGVDYPAILFTVFNNDSRVDPMHARKMCAALQHATEGRSVVTIRQEPGVGHGARSKSKTVELSTDMLSFLAHHTGLRL